MRNAVDSVVESRQETDEILAYILLIHHHSYKNLTIYGISSGGQNIRHCGFGCFFWEWRLGRIRERLWRDGNDVRFLLGESVDDMMASDDSCGARLVSFLD